MSEPTEEELREVGAAPRASKKTIVFALIAGVLAALVLVAAAHFAAQRDRSAPAGSEAGP
jgi:hypothetical protein